MSVSNATCTTLGATITNSYISLTHRVQFCLNITATARGMDLCLAMPHQLRRVMSALSLGMRNATLLGTTLSVTITNGYNISDTALQFWLNITHGAGNGSVLGDVASSIATSDEVHFH